MNYKNKMRKTLIIIFLIQFLAVLHGCKEAKGIDINSKKVIAVVNGDVIYEGDVYRRIQAAYGDIEKEKLPPSRWEMMFEGAIESEIIDKLLLKAAIEDGLKISSEKIDEILSRTREKMGEENFYKMLKSRNASEDEFKKFLEERELIEAYKDRLFKEIKIDEASLKQYYEGHKEEFSEPEKIRLEVITVRDMEQAKTIYKRWIEGETFEKLAEEFNKKPDEKIGRRLKWMPYDAIPVQLQPLVKAKKKEEILEPTQVGEDIYIIKILDYRPDRALTFEESKDRIQDFLLIKKQGDLIDQWYKKRLQEVEIKYVR